MAHNFVVIYTNYYISNWGIMDIKNLLTEVVLPADYWKGESRGTEGEESRTAGEAVAQCSPEGEGRRMRDAGQAAGAEAGRARRCASGRPEAVRPRRRESGLGKAGRPAAGARGRA